MASPDPTTTAQRTTVPATTTARPTASRTSTTTPNPTPTSVSTAHYSDGRTGYYYFTSPTAKFECGLFLGVGVSPAAAGCHGALPPNAPKVPGPGVPESMVAPNTIEVLAGSPAQFVSSGDPRFHRFDGPAVVLPYGTVLTAGGISCTTDTQKGISCQDDSGHGFTVSDSEYTLR
ncbi:hypothetical protein [Rhodococcus sp. ABRD24]|uniref:hypothetical protein n=1 Tax=Rhodococcus sp. ABRD24 TaxID=2507582 RepID=UPI001F60FC19|nr:hypothetical protein [Rhodococcus sp. ABRD24]